MRRALVATLCLLAAPAAADPITLLPGVLVDPAASVTYIMRDGAVEAVTSAGKTRWMTKKVEKPLWLSGTRLLAQQGTSLVVLDAASGKITKTCTPAKGTSWQPPPIQGGLRGSSSMSASDAGAGKALLRWSTETHYMGGMAPTPEMVAAAASYSEGTVEVDLAGCTFAERSTYTAPKAKPGQPIARTPVAGAGPALPPTTVDGVEIKFEIVTDAGGTAHAVLHRKQNGKALADVEVATAKAPYVHTLVSADGRQVLAVAQDPTSGGGGVFYYDHTLVDAVTGAKLGAFRLSWHAGVVVRVADGTLVEATSRTVHAVDLKAGKERWKRDVRHTWYEGPLPP